MNTNTPWVVEVDPDSPQSVYVYDPTGEGLLSPAEARALAAAILRAADSVEGSQTGA